MINVNFAYNESWRSAFYTLETMLSIDAWRGDDNCQQLEEMLPTLVAANQVEAGANQARTFLTLSARAALNMLLKSLELDQGDQVLVQAFTCEAVVLPIINCGLTPVYVDFETQSFSIDMADLKKKMTDRCRVLILQHTFGMTPVNRQRILQLAAQKKIVVIEDLAHGFHQSVFSPQDQTFKLFSFGRSKLFSSVHGGAVIINDQAISRRFDHYYQQLANPSWSLILKSLLYKLLGPMIISTYPYGVGKLLHRVANDFNLFTREISAAEKSGSYDSWLEKRLPPIFARLLVKDIVGYQAYVAAKIDIARFYQQQLKTELFGDNLPILRFPVLVDDRQTVLAELRKKDIHLGDWYSQVVAPVELDLSQVQYRPGSCPRAEKATARIINLPTNINLYQAQVIVEQINRLQSVQSNGS